MVGSWTSLMMMRNLANPEFAHSGEFRLTARSVARDGLLEIAGLND